ncbi:hypothetical protein PIB30_067508, partial [Stylosanthes scabra]|nr:hypothetical protein [Stylosanthes scabra]
MQSVRLQELPLPGGRGRPPKVLCCYLPPLKLLMLNRTPVRDDARWLTAACLQLHLRFSLLCSVSKKRTRRGSDDDAFTKPQEEPDQVLTL